MERSIGDSGFGESGSVCRCSDKPIVGGVYVRGITFVFELWFCFAFYFFLVSFCFDLIFNCFGGVNL